MAIDIRSYRSVFELERRIYRVDRAAVESERRTAAGAVYALTLLLAALVAAALPLAGTLARVLPWYVRDLALPVGGAALLTVIRVDGRPFHLAAWALAGYVLGPSRIRGSDPAAPMPAAQWRPQEMVVLADGSETKLRQMLCTGPAQVRVAVAHERTEWRDGLMARLIRREGVAVRELSGRRPPRLTQTISLRPGVRLRVR